MRLFINILCFFTSFASIAQQQSCEIRGVVRDEASHATIPYASVIIINSNPLIGTTTLDDGSFALENLSAGRYDLKISMVGYEPVIIHELLLSSSKQSYQNVYLKESISMLEGVTITPKINKEAPINAMATVSARMLSVEESRRYAGGFDDPARLASSFAGVASNIGSNGIVIRGNAPKSLQWKLEGVEIPNPNHFANISAFGGGGLTALSTQLMSNSDFLTGAFPATYSNALSGVFDLEMREGNNQEYEHTFQLGLIGIDFASEGPLSKKKSASYLFNYRYSTLSLLTPLLPDDAEGTQYQDLAFKFHFPTKKAGVFSFWGIGLIDHSGQKAEPDSLKRKYDQDFEQGDVNQYMAASGINHIIFVNRTTRIKTTLAATSEGLDFKLDRIGQESILKPENVIKTRDFNVIMATNINRKFGPRHTNQTGFSANRMSYDYLLQSKTSPLPDLETISDKNGNSWLISGYTASSINIGSLITINAGITAQYFNLNQHGTIEPRIGIKYQLNNSQHIAFAYGNHSRLEKLNFYFVKTKDNQLINKNMDFSKAHHFVISYGRQLSEYLFLKTEIYYQHLYKIPVIADSSYSFINLQNDWFFDQKLENTGKGRNYGFEITLERFMNKGFYYLFTGSVFNAEYSGGDGIWRNTRYNRNFILNLLAGKEWTTDKTDRNVLGLSVRLSFQGGDRYSPVDIVLSQESKEVVYDESKAYSLKTKAFPLLYFTFSYKMNRQKVTHEFALKILNATNYADFNGFRYNYITNQIDENREAIMIPNISYRIDF